MSEHEKPHGHAVGDQITSTLIFSSNKTEDGHDDPHCSGVLTIPTANIEEYIREIPKLEEIWNALSWRDKRNCKKEGALSISVDYGYKEEVQEGVGAIALDYEVDVEKLSDDKKENLRNWITDEYGVQPKDIAFDIQLQEMLDDSRIKDHITTDMTVSSMRLDKFLEAWKTHKEGGEEFPYPLEKEHMDRIAESIETRYGSLDALKTEEGLAHCYADIVKMREVWPNALPNGDKAGKGFTGPEISLKDDLGLDDKKIGLENSSAAVPFYTGAVGYDAEYFIGAGPYATTPPWAQSSGRKEFDAYDENGIACTEEGKRIHPKRLEPLDGYNYVSEGKAVTVTLNADELKAAFEQIAETQEQTVPYNGYTTNCMKVAMQTIMGEANMKAFEEAAFLWAREHPDPEYGKNFLNKGQFDDLSTEVQWKILRDATAAPENKKMGHETRTLCTTEITVHPSDKDLQGLGQTIQSARNEALGKTKAKPEKSHIGHIIRERFSHNNERHSGMGGR